MVSPIRFPMSSSLMFGATTLSKPRSLGELLLSYSALARLYTTVPIALLSYAVAAGMGISSIKAIAGAAAIAFGLAGGYAYNDLRDQAADGLNRPRRPLVSGRLTDRHVSRFIFGCYVAALALVIVTRSLTVFAFIALLILSSTWYSDVIKGVVGIKNVFVGLWSGLLPWGAVLDQATPSAMLPAVIIVALFITQKELVADIYDRVGDAAAGVRTVPVVVGPRAALGFVGAVNLLSFGVARFSAAPVLVHLARGGELVAIVNTVAVCALLLRSGPVTVRGFLDLQKVFMIGGCLALFALIAG